MPWRFDSTTRRRRSPRSGSPVTCTCARAALVRAQRRRLGARARAAGRAAARVQARGRAPRRRHRVDLRSRQPEARARARSARSRCSSCRATSAPAWLEAETVEGRYDEADGPRARARRARRGARLVARPTPSRATPLRMLLANDGPEYDALSAAHPLRRREDRRRRAAAVPGRAARARRPRQVVLAPRPPTAACSTPTSCPALREAFGVIGAPAAMGATLGGAGDAARPAPLPARVRRAVPAVRDVLHAALRRARAAASAATRGSSASSATRCATASTRSRSR